MAGVESFKPSSEAGSSGTISVGGDGDSSSTEGPDRPFILLDKWEVNKYYTSLSKKRLLKTIHP